MTAGQLFGHYTYWPRQYAVGFLRLWQFNGPLVACRLTAQNLLRIRKSCRVTLFGVTLELRTGTPDLAVALESLGHEFEPVTQFADPGGLIIDAGGYIGTAALKLAAAFPRSKVVCLEPSVENLKILRRNVEGVANIVVMEVALAATEGEATLHDRGTGEWGFSILADQLGAGRALGAVPTVTVDGILAHEGGDRLFLLKLDVEGSEREILAAGTGWISRTDIIIAELHERLAPGAGAAFEQATAGRANRLLPGEKVISLGAGFGG